MLKEQTTLPRGFVIRDPAGNSYVIEGVLGKGGSSAVYLVKERGDKKQEFALKELIDPDRRQREHFIFEWETLKRLDHPALPKVYYVFEHQKLRRVYILMTYIKGFDLERLRVWQPNKCFSLPIVLALMSPIVSAVLYLHDQDPPVVHRDIKPSNIIVPEGGYEAVLVDFSIAKEYVPNSTTTAVRHGSPGYAAPEQYATGTTPLTDVYGLGATLYTLLTGTLPTDALTRLTEGKRDPLHTVKEIVPDIPAPVSAVVERAMSLNREDRFTDVEQLWQVFTEAADEQEASPVEITELTTGNLPDIQLRPIEEITTLLMHKKDDIPVVSRRKAPLVLLALFLLAVIASGLLYFGVYTKRLTPHPEVTAAPTIVVRATHPPLSPTPYPTLSPYPILAQAYSGKTSYLAPATPGTTVDSPTQELKFVILHQTGGQISGNFSALAQAGTFTGTVTKDSTVTFRASIYSNGGSIVFAGYIQLYNGSLGGHYYVYNSDGQRTGDYGSWNVTPAS